MINSAVFTHYQFMMKLFFVKHQFARDIDIVFQLHFRKKTEKYLQI